MRIIALILTLLSGVVGFALSYGIAYREVSGALYAPAATMQSSTPLTNGK